MIARMVLESPYELGGLKMISTKFIVESAKIMFIKRLCNNKQAKWKVLALELIGISKQKL